MQTARRTTVASEADNIKVDFASIPDYVREELAAATLESIQSFLKQPGAREYLDTRKAKKKAAKKAAK